MQPKLIHASKQSPCPICTRGTDWCYSLSDSLRVCKRTEFAPPGWRRTTKQDSAGHFIFAIEGDDPDWQEKKAQWDAQRLEREENQRLANLEKRHGSLTAAERDPLIRSLSKELGLFGAHRQILLDRGLTKAQIDAGLFFSIEKWQKVSNDYPLNLPGVSVSKFGDRQLNGQGIAIVTFDVDRLATGWQILSVPRLDGTPKYPWAKGEKSSHLPLGNGIGELPIQVIGSPGKKKIAYLAEGTLKPKLAGYKHDEYFVGASSGNFSSSPVQVKAALEGIKTVVITLDGGDVTNPARMLHWQHQHEFLVSLGVKVKFLWWSQFKKEKNDIDEISNKKFRNAKLIDLDYFLKLPDRAAQAAQDRLLFEKLSGLSLPVTYERSEEYLSELPLPKLGTFSFVTSPCGTGKTEQVVGLINRWEKIYPQGKFFFFGYRNGLLDQTRRRASIPSYRVGYGQDDAAINNYQKLAICLDSLLKLRLESIPANTLVFFDEFEAILKHGTQSKTLGNRRAAIQAHLVAILDRVLSTGGAVVGLEDSLTDLSINGILDLTNRQYPYEILRNTMEKFHWQVKMGGGNPSHYMGLIIDRLKRGENIIVPSTSQKFIQTLERMIVAQMPELKDSIFRLDAKTAPDLHDLLTDPDGWLAQQKHPVRILFLSPTVESGFSIKLKANKHWFDRSMAYFTNLDTRTHIQMLSRDRSNIPRDIFALAKGTEAGSARGRDPIALLKMRKAIANETSLLHGAGRIPMSAQGNFWNCLDSQFSVRSDLSSKYLGEYLELDLIARGHNVTQVDWEEVRLQELADNKTEDAVPSKELGVIFKKTKLTILAEDNKVLFDADGKKMAVVQAQAILHSSSSTFEQKQQAVKCMIHDRLPGIELTEDFLMVLWSMNNAAYLKQCELSWLLRYPDLAKHLERVTLAHQAQQPHIIYSQIPKLVQKIQLLLPIMSYINDLATGREYMTGDEAAVGIQEHSLKHGKKFFNLFGLNIKEESVLGKGNGAGSTQNSQIATVNKIVKLLGYQAQSVRRVGKAGAQERVYAIGNFDCPHREKVYKALDYKHRNYLSGELALEDIVLVFNTIPNIKSAAMQSVESVEPKPLSQAELVNIQSGTDTLADIVTYPLDMAHEALADIRSVWTAEFLYLASKNLTFAQRIILKKLVIEMNMSRIAS
ncbi:hypothetical protein [Chamaesiphon sp.]|uniref:hypothetical protein n=1 Tax=Chamaesiphon sp. TaxID=2814140 RepID=UPI0035931CFB